MFTTTILVRSLSALTTSTDFSDDDTGEAIHTCKDGHQYCPDQQTLMNKKVLEIWGEGVGGIVDLEIQRIEAAECTCDVM